MGFKGIQYLTLCLAVCISVGDARAPKKIVNGYYARLKQFPYQVSLQNGNSHFCGGVIIDETHILTAAHCVVEKNVHGQLQITHPGQIRVITGVINNADRNNWNTFAVSNVIPHENYTPYFHDIAILKLARAIDFNDFQRAIALPSHDPNVGAYVRASGWGFIDNMRTSIRDLIHLEMIVLNQQECQKYYRQRINPQHLCVYHASGKSGLCYGDSGGPLTYDNQLVGITSFGVVDSCGFGYPDVYTRVSTYIPWIQEVRRRTP